jgi:MEMO1 family protein
MNDKPTLRPVEVFPVETDRGTMICLRDPSGMSDRVVTASVHALAVLQLLDGKHSLRDIQADLSRRTGAIAQSDQLRGFIDVLDEALLLESERFEAHRTQTLKEFAESPVRRAASAGHSYPEDAAELRTFLDEVLAQSPAAAGPSAKAPRGLVAPHIDYLRGRETYARAYGTLARTAPAELYIVLGTAHADTDERFVLTRKDFETPLGRAATDAAVVEALAKSSGRDLFADEFAHRAEHSVELEIVFIQHLCQKAKRDFRVVPVLCAGYHSAMDAGKSPLDLSGVKGFIDGLRGVLAKESRRVCVVAGADLAHVGPRFGTPAKATTRLLADVERADRASLAFVERGDAEGFFGHLALDRNARNVCGVACVYTALKALEPCSAELLGYEQWAEDDRSSSVTFAACAIL